MSADLRAVTQRPLRTWSAVVLSLAAYALAAAQFTAAQQPAPSVPPSPQPTQPTPQPEPGAQVHTGTSSGIDADTRLQILLTDHQYTRLEQELNTVPAQEAQLYRGVLANRNNDTQTSIRLLEPLVDAVTASGDTAHEKLLRTALAEDYLRAGDWGKAAAEYQQLESRLGSKLTPDERDEIEMPLKMLPLAAANPPMTVDPCEPFQMQVSKDPLGLIEIPVFVDAQPHRWMLDPTAPFNLIARSTAREVGLRISDQAATIHTLTGRAMQVHATVIPRFTIGGRITLHNVTAFVYEDADYAFPRSRYQVQGVLGYPALMALGSLTITADDTIAVQPASGASPQTDMGKPSGARFFLDGDQVIVGLGPAGNEQMFAVDAGGQQSYLTSRWFDEHAAEFTGKKMELYTVPGSGQPAQPAYVAETVPLDVAGARAEAHFLEVLTQPIGAAALDDVYGVLGLDVLDQFRSYTFNYRTMRFSVVPEPK